MPLSDKTKNILKVRLGDPRASDELVAHLQDAREMTRALHGYCKELYHSVSALIDACKEAGVEVEKPAPPPEMHVSEKPLDQPAPSQEPKPESPPELPHQERPAAPYEEHTAETPPAPPPQTETPPDQPQQERPSAPYEVEKPAPPPPTEEPKTEGV